MSAPLPPRFSATVAAEGEITVVAVEGELDLEHADLFDVAMVEAVEQAKPIVVDFARCVFMDSTGLQRLLRHREGASRAGIGFALAVTDDGAVGRLIDLVAPGLFVHAPSVGEARTLATSRG